ncbi:MAG: hypothetical protein JKY14_08610 [Paraglaciecola sp.]|nr:hypothetical protein [Paraglaciecola sp.]
MQNYSFTHPFKCLMAILLGASVFLSSSITFAEEAKKNQECKLSNQYTFSWQFLEQCDMKPRGGTSKGNKIVLDPSVNEAWLAIQEEGISPLEKDRRAILAMAGAYRVSFDFIEIAGYVPGFVPSKPYQSWGTEYVYVVEDNKKFISLQHVMVMFMTQKDGSISEPMVMKHWRQDWQYEKRSQFVYAGHRTWKKSKQKSKDVKGTWSQAVFQVDDSPRYESFGKWQHNANVSSWLSAKTWRPLPRREGSVRNDYHVLEGTNRHTILPSGWVQEEENLKLVLDKQGKAVKDMPYLSKELGIARYERIVEHDFSAGDHYWNGSKKYWSDVRSVWKDLINSNDTLVIHKKANKQYMFMPFFSKAQAIVDGEKYRSSQGKKIIRETLVPFIELNE